MVTNEDVFNMAFYKKKKPFTGSVEGIRYRILLEIEETEDGSKKEHFSVWVWKDLFCFEVTPQEEMQKKEFEFSEAGKQQAVDWINEMADYFKKEC